jgi:hypothetical protein
LYRDLLLLGIYYLVTDLLRGRRKLAKTVKHFALLALMAAVAFFALANTANATTSDSNSFLSPSPPVKGAFLTVRTQPSEPNARVTVTCSYFVWVKVEDGSWLGKWSRSATTSADSQGIAKFRIVKVSILGNARTTITVNGCQQTMRRICVLRSCSTAPTYVINILSRQIQVVPEAPLGAGFATILMIAAFGAYFIYRKQKHITI